MVSATALMGSLSSPLLEPLNAPLRRHVRSSTCQIVCTSERRSSAIPKLEPFSRNRIDRMMPEPSFLQKFKNDLTEYCTILEGDECYSCWRAYFELQDLEKEWPKEDVEKILRQADGVKTMIGYMHGITAMQKKHKAKEAKTMTPLAMEEQKERAFHVPDGLPKSQEEMEEEERCRMPDSPFTRLLRSKSSKPAWYSEVPGYEHGW